MASVDLEFDLFSQLMYIHLISLFYDIRVGPNYIPHVDTSTRVWRSLAFAP
jgi:hypothetical protein